jgi:hypothetical protein
MNPATAQNPTKNNAANVSPLQTHIRCVDSFTRLLHLIYGK